MSDHDRKSQREAYDKEELESLYAPNNNNSIYSNGTLHYCSIYRYFTYCFLHTYLQSTEPTFGFSNNYDSSWLDAPRNPWLLAFFVN